MSRTSGEAARPKVRSPRIHAGFTLLELLVVIGVILVLIALLLPNVRTARGSARRSQCRNNLKQIALALRNYEETYRVFPPAYTVDANGRKLHSWRTLILPFLESSSTYERIDFSKPWDDPVNATARDALVSAYLCPDLNDQHTTNYLAVVGPTSFFPPSGSRRVSEIRSDHGNVVMVFEVPVDRAVHWMSPDDTSTESLLNIEPDSRLPHQGGMNATFADGTVHWFHAASLKEELRERISAVKSDN